MNVEIKKSPRWLRLKEIFESQVWALERLVTNEESRKQVAFLRDGPLKRHVLTRALELGLENAAIPILAVIPRNCMETSRQISFIKCRGINGTAELNLNRVRDIEEIPHHHPYWAFDVSIGIETVGMTAREAIEKIAVAKRRPLTLAEIIALYIQYPQTLEFSANACGSRYGVTDDVDVPAIYTCFQRPTATWNHLGENRVENVVRPWVSPSCLERMGNLGVMTYIQRRRWRKREGRE
jgi:hypothetical protein